MTKEERAAYMREWRARNQDKIRATKKRYRERHKAQLAAYMREYRQRHPELKMYHKIYNIKRQKREEAQA